jgi:5-methyltetrahydropteroyltriglutamate--homocysteine methyltransferase
LPILAAFPVTHQKESERETMTARKTPPFRADQVGSLLRPDNLKAARAKHAENKLSDAELRKIEDDCIRDVVKMQENLGLEAITDGELRRESWQRDFLRAMDGVTFIEDMGSSVTAKTPHAFGFAIKDKIKNPNGIMTEDFGFLKPLVSKTAKVCIPSPTLAYHRGGKANIDKTVYPDIKMFWDDVVDAWKSEIDHIAKLGGTYVQVDDTCFAMLCDQRAREALKERGDDPEELLLTYCDVVSRSVAGRPANMRAAVHMCRGNFESNWNGEGGYEAVAEKMFANLKVDGFFMEWDNDRSGGFEPLRFVQSDQTVVLGLVTSKSAELETKDMLKRRIDEASKYVSVDNLCLSPQCGFASTAKGNKLTVDDQKRKLALVIETADDVWGRA